MKKKQSTKIRMYAHKEKSTKRSSGHQKTQIDNIDTTKTTTDIPIWDIQNITIDNSVYNLVQKRDKKIERPT